MVFLKTHKNILVAFLLNAFFSIVELVGGMVIGSIAILSDAIHDFSDCLSIAISYILEKKSKSKANDSYTYGYLRYSILGACITTCVLITGSIFVIYEALKRLFFPVVINYHGMILLAIFGVLVNFLAAYFTKDGSSLNQKAVNLHMLEDVLGWIVVLVGAVIMRFTNWYFVDSLMSIGVAIFIFTCAVKNLKTILDLFLEKVPDNIYLPEIKEHILAIANVLDVHHIHIWSLDGVNNCCTMHVVTNQDDVLIKKQIRKELSKQGINHVTIEIEKAEENCHNLECDMEGKKTSHHHH